MKLIRTAKIKLNIEVADILPTLQAYTKAFNFVCQVGYDKKNYNGVQLHKLTYYTTREYLPAQLAISARMKATEALKSIFSKKKKLHKKFLPKCPQSKLSSIRLDANSYSLFLNSKEVSILTIDGRKRYPLKVSAYHQQFFSSWKHTSADLCIDKKTNKVYLHIVFQKDIADVKKTGKLIGIDRGINNIAVTSENKFYTGDKVKEIHNRYQTLRNKLQSKGTPSAKRHLKKLSKQERRFRADINHQISKEIVESLSPGDTIVLENLSGIRNKRRNKAVRTLINNWSYFQLEQFLIYKAAARGIFVEYIDARYTSQRCSKCGHIERSNRKQDSFCCKQCNFKLNSDLNASRNIVIKALDSYMLSNGALVNEPIVSAVMLDTSPAL